VTRSNCLNGALQPRLTRGVFAAFQLEYFCPSFVFESATFSSLQVSSGRHEQRIHHSADGRVSTSNQHWVRGFEQIAKEEQGQLGQNQRISSSSWLNLDWKTRALCVSPQNAPLTTPANHVVDLKRELISRQVHYEISELNSPTALRRFGAPFKSDLGEVAPVDSELPILRYIFVNHVRNFPFLDKAREKEFWQDKLQVVSWPIGRLKDHVLIQMTSSSNPSPKSTYLRPKTASRRQNGGSLPSSVRSLLSS
jgi:PX-associated